MELEGKGTTEITSDSAYAEVLSMNSTILSLPYLKVILYLDPCYWCGSCPMCICPRNQALRNFFMGYYRQAIAEIERGVVVIAEETCAKSMPHGLSACQGVPIVGASVDRRTFGHLREVYNDKAIFTLTCFICAQRRTHTKHPNSAITRRCLELFTPDHTARNEKDVE